MIFHIFKVKIILLFRLYFPIVTFIVLDIGKIIGNTFIQVRNELVGFVKIIVEQLRTLPAFHALKEQVDQVSMSVRNSNENESFICIKTVNFI